MKRRLFSIAIYGPLLLLQSLAALAQGSGAATHVSESDIMAALQGITNLPDQQVRTVDVGGGLNIAIGVLHRGATSTDEGEGVSSIAHHNIIEVYYVLSGSGILVTGGEVVREREIPAASEIVKELVGPSVLRTISGGESVVISEGDAVIIPAGISHGFSKILDSITYLSIRVDPDQVLPAGYKHPLIQ